MIDEIGKKEAEIESLSIQLATFKTENDELLKERIEKKKEFRRLDEIKEQLAAKEQENEALSVSWVRRKNLRVDWMR